MADFFAELKRRHIYRVGAAYVVVAWALTQVIDVLSQVFELPSWVAQPAIVLLVIGFPVALVAAWMIESKPHEAVASVVRSKPTLLDGALFGALIIVGLLIGYQQLTPRGVDAARSAAASSATAISLAVLPFANLSGDPTQEFFSDGITEEITSALARVPDLRVVARTSAYQFRDQNRDIQSIGQQLRATHFIEGSVRKAGDRVRITAQLIKADDGTHIWADDYDRQLVDIFAIQEDIARTVVASLRMPLGLKSGENLVNNRKIDPDAYQQYLRAKALVGAGVGQGGGGRRRLNDATALVEGVVRGNPEFAPGWGLLAQVYIQAPNASPEYFSGSVEELRRVVNEFFPKAESAARRAIQLDPSLPQGYVQLSRVQSFGGNKVQALDLYAKALALDPADGDSLNYVSLGLLSVGRFKESLAMRKQLRELEPLVPVYETNSAMILWVNGQDEQAIAAYKEQDFPLGLAWIYASEGRYSEAADEILKLPAGGYPKGSVETAARLMRTAPAKTASLESLPSLGALDFVYLYVGAPERVLDWHESRVEAHLWTSNTYAQLWHPAYAPVRRTERFKALMRKSGIADYWRAEGWPPFCHPTSGEDFACE
jgi:TolB-like protein/tetratricopeptide (TPR) repeat protein